MFVLRKHHRVSKAKWFDMKAIALVSERVKEFTVHMDTKQYKKKKDPTFLPSLTVV